MTNSDTAYSCPDDLNDWVLSHWHLVDKLARRRFRDEVIAEEASLYVMEQCSADNWQRLRSFAGSARFSTFFCSVTYRLLEDFSRRKFGRLRAPAWLTRLGGIWLYLFRLLCQERHPLHEAVMIAESRYAQPQAGHQMIAEQILTQIPSCGKIQHRQEPLTENTVLRHDDHPLSTQHHKLEGEEKRLFLAALAVTIFGDQTTDMNITTMAGLFETTLQLTGRERLLLKLCHRDGLSVAAAGRMLGLNRFQVHGQLKRLYRRIQQQLAEAGMAAELHQLLEE
jgi:RNA polymerase sigma factor (sigma-70 family)